MTSLRSLKKEYGMKTKNDDFMDTGWSQPSGQYVLRGTTMSQVYIGYLSQIWGVYRQPYSDPKKAIEAYERRMEINKEIEALNKKIAAEPSVAKKQELARERHELERELK